MLCDAVSDRVCIVCLCPTKKTLGFYGLKTTFSHLSDNVIVYVLKYLVCYNLTSPGDNGSYQLIIQWGLYLVYV